MFASASQNASKAAHTSQAKTRFRKSLSTVVPDLYGRALHMARSQEAAEDLVQDTVERALRFEDTYKPDTNLKAWLFQILFSVFITRCRKLRRERNAMVALTSDPHEWTAPESPRLLPGISPPVARALDGLPQCYRDVLLLVDVEELSYKDAADILGVPNGTVMSRLHRGRRALSEALGVQAEPAPVAEAA